MHTNIGPNDHLQSDKTSTQNHPNANPKSPQNHNRHPRRHPDITQTTSNSLQQIIHTPPNDQPHIIQEPTQNHPNITPNIINPSHTFQPFAKVKSTNPQSTIPDLPTDRCIGWQPKNRLPTAVTVRLNRCTGWFVPVLAGSV